MNEQDFQIQAIALRVLILENSHSALKEEVLINTRITMQVKDDTGDIVAFTQSLGKFVKFMKAFGVFLKWAASIATAVAAIWAFFRGFRPW